MKVQNVSNEVVKIYVSEGKVIKNLLEPGQTIELSDADAKWNALNDYGRIEMLGKKKGNKGEEVEEGEEMPKPTKKDKAKKKAK